MEWRRSQERRRGRQASAFQDLLKGGQNKLKQIMPGGAGLSGSFIFLVAAVIAAIAPVPCGASAIPPDSCCLKRQSMLTHDPLPALAVEDDLVGAAEHALHGLKVHALRVTSGAFLYSS
jgi:hypothetical protein